MLLAERHTQFFTLFTIRGVCNAAQALILAGIDKARRRYNEKQAKVEK